MTSGRLFGPGPGVLLLDGVTYGGNAALQELLGHRELLGREVARAALRYVFDGVSRRGSSRSPRLPPAGPAPGRTACVRRTPTARRSVATPGTRVARGSPPARAPPSLPSRRGADGRPAGGIRPAGPSPRSSRRRLRLGGQHHVDVGPALGRAEDLDPVRPGVVTLALGGRRAVTVVPSRVVSTSARSTVPTPVPSGTREASTVPRGCLAPAARHVQAESPV